MVITDLNLVKFPTTRYQGSKAKLIPWIEDVVSKLDFDTVLDAFGGTGAVSFLFKKMGKEVHYNDLLQFNYYIGVALIENNKEILTEDDIQYVLTKHKDVNYPDFISKTFQDIYFTDEENVWLDTITFNIRHIANKYKQALAYFALFQACMIKRPFSLFHRKNLYVRTAQVPRSFGNKKTWDTAFDIHFRKFVAEANNIAIDNGRINVSTHTDVFEIDNPQYDLVYIDTPYISQKGTGVDYLDFYHFLEGVVNYEEWNSLLDTSSKHKKIKTNKNEWADKRKIKNSFYNLFDKYKEAILVVSYRDNGIPTTEELVQMLSGLNKTVAVYKRDYQYVLSTSSSKEVLIVAK